ncbi:unnamed protein product, partial [Mesorhabditis belari]|uniref:Sulfatase N-terminal domain-containing protein n=1 Tax=Mesorhabditis belari TaxID=2138241 RepID=A0AAF3J6K2_9BILA
MDFMPKTRKLLQEKGVEFSGGFVTTPICCPSRSSILTGLYVHNHNVHTNNNNCSGAMWRKHFEPHTFGVHLKESGYKTAYFGKYLNEYNGQYVPPGWSHWMGLLRNSRFYNYTLNVNGKKQKFGAKYETDYLSDVITNASLDWISTHLFYTPEQPFLVVLSYPAPHGPEDPAPQYSNLFPEIFTHRTESWNYAPNPDKQWILQHTGKMEPVHVAFTDILHRRRIQTLQSVDDSVHKILTTLRDENQLANSYVIYTSDHGYHLGQFGLIKGKNMPYEFDIRVPFLMRGPGLPKNLTIRKPVANIDIAPTILHMAELEIPDSMDGRSLLDLIALEKNEKKAEMVAPWRDTLLIERGKMPKLKQVRDRWMRQKAKYSKEARLAKECLTGKWSAPCSQSQLWKCYIAEDGRWRIYKCHHRKRNGCDCKVRKKREENQETLIDQFLFEIYVEEMKNSSNWHQGVFDFEKDSQKRMKREKMSICDCEGNFTSIDHPLKDMEKFENELENDLIAYRRAKKQFKNGPHSCSLPQMNCFTHGASHWRTPPLWPEEFGEFCFCQNSNNNTYWCLRTLNSTHNFLYCEFVTEFISYYDLNTDPFQLTNVVYSLDMSTLESLSLQLRLLRKCRGRKECERASSSHWTDLLIKI